MDGPIVFNRILDGLLDRYPLIVVVVVRVVPVVTNFALNEFISTSNSFESFIFTKYCLLRYHCHEKLTVSSMFTFASKDKKLQSVSVHCIQILRSKLEVYSKYVQSTYI